jgi:AraC family transcriptional regulator of adaptative response/methylated-DNA-[protein]-cysteine methyltransferase
MDTMPTVAEMERAYLAGDASYSGLFFLGVRTTGIFCRPGCPARKPLPRNVEYFPTPTAAMNAGYRACKRCQPLAEEPRPAWVASLLTALEEDPSLRIPDKVLSERGIDPRTARRYFLDHYGMTFQALSRARRLSGALDRLRDGERIDDAVHGSGYDSHSGFRDAFARMFRAAPGRGTRRPASAPAGGPTAGPGREPIFLTRLASPLGPLVGAATAEGVCLLELSDRRMLEKQLATVGRLFGGPVVPRANEHLTHLQEELTAYFEGRLQRFTVPLLYPGTPFQRRVWDELLRIPYGETRSYEDLASAVGVPGGARAVGHANGLNRICFVIPCHRVVNKDGRLGGYGGGLRRKEYLLALEKRHRAASVS